MLALRGQDRSTPIPFGPFIAAAGWVWFLLGDGSGSCIAAYFRRALTASIAQRSSTMDRAKRPFTVALTGGIASGKSECARRFAALGASVIDADVVARELVQPGMPALGEIAADVRSADARRERIARTRRDARARCSATPQARRRLEAILHPRVRAEMLVRTTPHKVRTRCS